MSSSILEGLKIRLVKAVRMLEKNQLLDMNGHVSCRLPGTDTFLINARQASRASITVNDVVLCDLEGKPIGDYIEPPSEVYIHTSVYKRREDVFSIVHGHPHWQTVLGIAGIDLKPVFGVGSFIDEVNTYEKSSLVNIPEMGEELADVLANGRVAQLRNHGNLVVGEDVVSAFAATVYVEESAKKQYYAELLNSNIKVLEGENLIRTRETSWSSGIAKKVWNYYEEKSRKEGALEGILETEEKGSSYVK